MYRRFAAAALLVALALPASALAADPSAGVPAPARPGGAWEIVSIETPGGSVKVGGRLAIGPDLTASVGCNTMSAPVTSFDGTNLVIGPVATTEIGCPADLAKAEGYLAAVLGAGTLTLDGTSLASGAGRIGLGASQPAQPNATPPDAVPPIATPPPAGPMVDPATCAALLGSEWDLAAGSAVPGATGGSSGSGSSSAGSGGAGSGTSGSGGAGATTGTVTVEEGSGPVANPPIAIASAVPVGPPMPPVPATGAPAPEAATVTLPEVTALPLPVVVSPGASVSLEDACRALLAALRSGKGAPIPPGGAIDGGGPVTAPTAEHAATMALSSSTDLTGAIAVAGLAAVAAGLLAGLYLLRRAQALRAAGGEPPAAEV